jgi:hypothetical protein
MLVLKDRAEPVRTRAKSYPLPRDVKAQYRKGAAPDDVVLGGSISWSTAWTTLDWLWLDEGVRLRGELTWPEGADPIESHAASLLDIAERSFVEGCPSANLPRPPPGPDGRVSGLDEDPSTLSQTERALWTRLFAFERSAACETTAR